MVAIHERIERITPELLTIQRLDPARVLAAKRTAMAPSDLEAGILQAYGDDRPGVIPAARGVAAPEGEARL